ncbi:MAG: porin [Planctomycetota bacterium]|nr:porin [Planctomycetota bacterium]
MKIVKLTLFASVLVLSGAVLQSVNGQDAPQGSSSFDPTFNPFFWLQIESQFDLGDEDEQSLMLQKARFGANGKVAEDLSYHFMFDGAVGGSDERETKLLQTFLRYSVSDRTSLRLGQFKYPFGIGTYPSFSKWDFNHPAFINGGIARDLVRRDAGTGPGFFRDFGLEVASSQQLGSGYRLGYKVMAMNGNGILKNDDNNSLDFVGRASLSSPKKGGFGTWTVGTSFYTGSLHLEGDPTIDTDDEAHDEDAWGVDFRWDLHEDNLRVATVQAEMITATTEAGSHDIITDGTVSPGGFYVQGSYFTSPDLFWAVRFEEFDHDEDTDGLDSRDRTTVGVGYYPYGQKKLHRINVNYERHDDLDHGTDDQISVAVTLIF